MRMVGFPLPISPLVGFMTTLSRIATAAHYAFVAETDIGREELEAIEIMLPKSCR